MKILLVIVVLVITEWNYCEGAVIKYISANCGRQVLDFKNALIVISNINYIRYARLVTEIKMAVEYVCEAVVTCILWLFMIIH